MATGQATINVRIDATTKSRGDEVLRRFGISTTEAVKLLWRELARTKELPQFLAESGREEERAQLRRKRAALAGLRGIAKPGAELSDEALDALVLQCRVADYEALS